MTEHTDPKKTKQPEDPHVTIQAKVIAAGRSDTGKLKVALQLTPVPTKDNKTGFALRQWPSKAREALRALNVAAPDAVDIDFSVVTSGATGSPSPHRFQFSALSQVFPAQAGLGKAEPNLAAVQAVWEETFTKFDNKKADTSSWPWAILKGLLNQSRKGSSWGAAMGATTNDDSGKPAVEMTAVLDSRVRVMAPFAEILRARELLETIASVDASDDPRLDTEVRVMRAMKKKWDKLGAIAEQDDTEDPDPQATKNRVLKNARQTELAHLGRLYADAAVTGANAEFKVTFEELEKKVGRPPANLKVGLNATTLKTGAIEDLNTELMESVASYAYTTWYNVPKESKNDGDGNNPTDKIEGGATLDEDADALADPRADEIGQRFFNIQSTPALSRLFLLVVECEWADDKPLPVNGLFELNLKDVSSNVDGHAVKTLARIGNTDGKVQFWPALRRDTFVRGTSSPLCDQRHGLIALGTEYRDAPRFELTSLDVRSVAERLNETNRRRLAAARPLLAKDSTLPVRNTGVHWQPGGEAEAAAVAQLTSRRDTLLTAGLTILDGDRADATVRRVAAREFQNGLARASAESASVVLDADDLLQGYKIDVGVGRGRPKSGKDASEAERSNISTGWQTLMNRKLDFGADEAKDATKKSGTALVQSILSRLIGPVGETDRYEVDSALISSHIKFTEKPVAEEVKKKQNEKLKGQVLGIADQVIATWTGDPLAVDCAVSAKDKADAPDNLPFGRVIDLPGAGDATANAPHLRFGRHYRVGMRAVYQGGVSRSLEDALDHYRMGEHEPLPENGRPEIDAVLPSAIKAKDKGIDLPFRRFLRHERLLPPYLLLPASTVTKAYGKMGFENAAHAIIRSFIDENGKLTKKHDRATPEATVRYVMPPVVPQALAVLHGAYDAVKAARLPDDVKNVLINPVTGGFPAAEGRETKGPNSVVYLSGRKATYSPENTAETFFATMPSLSDSEAKRIEDMEEEKKVRYHVDPLAERYVIGVRFAGTRQYLDGPPRIVSTFLDATKTSNFGNVAPLKISIVKRERARDDKPSRNISDVLSEAQLNIELEEVLPGKKGTKTRGHGITVNLVRGDDLEVDIWCIPSKENIRKTLAVTESVAALAQASDASGTGTLWARFSNGFSKIAGTSAADLLKKAEDNEALLELSFQGPAGLPIASEKALDAVAGFLFEKLQMRPIDEIAAVRTFRVTHAVNRPLILPTLIAPTPPRPKKAKSLTIARPDRATFELFAISKAEERFDQYFRLNEPQGGIRELPLVVPDAHDFALGGEVQIDLDSSDGFEIFALTVSPRSPLIDDPARGRSAIDRRAGTWPKQRAYDPNKRVFEESYVPPNALLGFDVFPDGSTRLPVTKVKLFRVTNLKSARQINRREKGDGLELISIEQLYGISTGTKYKRLYDDAEGTHEVPAELRGAQVRLEHAFPDGKARELDLWIESISRFTSLMSTAPTQGVLGEFYPPEPLLDKDDSSRSAIGESVKVWLPATIRPASPQTRSPIPVFSWKSTGPLLDKSKDTHEYEISRTVLVRIPLKRGWFSSGEGERLGIVLWPPTIFENDTDVSTDTVLLPVDLGSAERRKVKLPDFIDSDLGAAGAYITRWGGDPIRGSEGGQAGNFISPAQFGNIGDDLSKGQAKIVHNVIMPVAVSDSEGKRTETLLVSLLTYVPRFDLDKEEWYVDVELHQAEAPDPFVRLGLVRYQPNAAPSLQVSEPVVEWTQLMPHRCMSAVVRKVLDKNAAGEMESKFMLDVTIKGQAYTSLATGKQEQTSEDQKNQHPQIKIAVFLEEESGGIAQRKNIQIVVVDNLDAKQRRTDSRQTTWMCALHPIWSSELTGSDGKLGRLVVHAEEVDMRQRASFDNEPIQGPNLRPTKDFAFEEYRASGPRFLARIEISPETLQK